MSPIFGDVADKINLGISIFRGQVVDAVFSAIAMAGTIGSAIAAPMKAIFHAVGDAKEVTKAVTAMSIIFGGANKIVSKLDDISKGIKTVAKTITNAIAKLKNNRMAKWILGKSKLNTIVSGIQKGVSSLLSRASQVISTVKTAVKKSIKKEAKTGNRVLWSGGKDAMDAAKEYAKMNGMKMLEGQREGNFLLQ